ncbi:MAG: radical SAM protein [Betaproteobacteria bacterium]|nr:radical SAM protein [Betaproteobacteria bacterium]
MPRKPGPALDPITFERMRRILPNLLERGRSREASGSQARPLPEEVAFKLTNRCDLRCAHCYQWNEDGYHHQLSPAGKRDDLKLSVIARVLEATRALGSNVYLWGGEPLVYREWDGLVDLLAGDPRWTSVCTNGTLIERRLPSLLKIASHLEVSISIDGFESEHDGVRGKGAFAKAMSGLRLLVAQKKAGVFPGQITVNFVITDAMVTRLFEFVRFLEQEGAQTVYVSFPWFISDETSAKMDRFFAEHFAWEACGKPSWHSYKYRLMPDRLDELSAELARIDAADWRLQVRYNPRLDPGEMPAFIAGSDKPAQNKTSCGSILTRMDIFPNGDVVSCKFFPEFRVGNLDESTVAEVWEGARFSQLRETVSRCGLMPVCAKCNLLYTRGM